MSAHKLRMDWGRLEEDAPTRARHLPRTDHRAVGFICPRCTPMSYAHYYAKHRKDRP